MRVYLGDSYLVRIIIIDSNDIARAFYGENNKINQSVSLGKSILPALWAVGDFAVSALEQSQCEMDKQNSVKIVFQATRLKI